MSVEEAEQAFLDGLPVIYERGTGRIYEGRIRTIAPRSSFQFQFEGQSGRETLVNFVNAQSLSLLSSQ